MSTEHIRFITVGFAELLANLPDPDDAIASDPALQDYWPDDYEPAVCDVCGIDEHTSAELAACIDSALGSPDPYDLLERDLWDAARDQPDPAVLEAGDDD